MGPWVLGYFDVLGVKTLASEKKTLADEKKHCPVRKEHWAVWKEHSAVRNAYWGCEKIIRLCERRAAQASERLLSVVFYVFFEFCFFCVIGGFGEEGFVFGGGEFFGTGEVVEESF